MRRSQSVRQVVYALIVLAVFMVILRVSRPNTASPVSATPEDESKIASHSAESPVNKQVSHQINALSSLKSKVETAHQQPANQPSAAAARKEDTSSKQDQPQAQEEQSYDAASVFSLIVNDPSSPPVIIFSKSYCPHSMRTKKLLLEAYSIQPAPKIIELDLIAHGAELQAYLLEKTGRRTVPNIVVSGVSRGGASEMAELGESLLNKFDEWGQGKLKIRKEQAVVEERS